MQAMARVQGEIKCIPTNTEKFMSFSLGNLRFIDSMNFMQSSLDKLVKGSEEFSIMQKIAPEEKKRQLLLRKGIYPYEHMDSFERFDETQLPEKEKFYSSLSGKGIRDEDYAHVQEVWTTFGCQTIGDYHELYVATDVVLLADVFEGLPRKKRAVPRTLQQRTRPELGRTAEEDRRRARATDGPGHALVHKAGDEGRDLDGRQKVRKGKQSAG